VTAAATPAAAAAPGGLPLAGLRVVLDAGNGAASHYAGELFESLGAEVVRLLAAAPDGRNVNLHCGSTAPERMAAETAAAGAHLGIAFDGDADRCILADERGQVRDGDAILYLWATHLLAQHRLAPPRIVATSMSNLGLERALGRHGIGVTRCGVGDRAVVETMRRHGILLGGEQSGHIVRLDLAPTGDGLLTAVQIAALVHHAARPLSDLLAGFRRYPQVLLNVPVARKPDLDSVPAIAAAARAVERELGADGRLVLRYSGTESLARVMIEGPDQAAIESLATRLAAVIAGELGNPAP
jgi:phosphoglucosamine mutase